MREKESFAATIKLSLKSLDLFSSLKDTLYTPPLRDSTHIHSGRGQDLSADWDSHGLGNRNDTCDVHFRENTWLTVRPSSTKTCHDSSLLHYHDSSQGKELGSSFLCPWLIKSILQTVLKPSLGAIFLSRSSQYLESAFTGLRGIKPQPNNQPLVALPSKCLFLIKKAALTLIQACQHLKKVECPKNALKHQISEKNQCFQPEKGEKC